MTRTKLGLAANTLSIAATIVGAGLIAYALHAQLPAPEHHQPALLTGGLVDLIEAAQLIESTN